MDNLEKEVISVEEFILDLCKSCQVWFLQSEVSSLTKHGVAKAMHSVLTLSRVLEVTIKHKISQSVADVAAKEKQPVCGQGQ